MIRFRLRKISLEARSGANEQLAERVLKEYREGSGAQAFSWGALLRQIWRGSLGCVPNGTPSHRPYQSNPKNSGKLRRERATSGSRPLLPMMHWFCYACRRTVFRLPCLARSEIRRT